MLPAQNRNSSFGPQRLPVEAVAVGASPYTYTAARNGGLVIVAGTMSDIGLSRDGAAATSIGAFNGTIRLAANDALTITYTVAPTVNFIPE